MDSKLQEAIFRLGQISADRQTGNHTLLRSMVEVAAEVIGIDVTGVAVYERGIDKPADACSMMGPWTTDETERFLEQSQWAVEDRVLAMRLVDLPRNKLYQRNDIIDDKEFRKTRLYNEFQRPLHLGDQAFGIYRRADGAELLFGINALDHKGEIPREVVSNAEALGPYLAHCWAVSWRREPEWMRRLKPQSRIVLEQVLLGFDDDQIADKTGLTYHSVRAHLKRLFREANVRSRLHLMQGCRVGRVAPLANGEVSDVVTVRQPAVAKTNETMLGHVG